MSQSYTCYKQHLRPRCDHSHVLPTQDGHNKVARPHFLGSYIIQPDFITSLTVCRTTWSGRRAIEAQLKAHHMRIIHIPAIVTHSAPLPAVINFNTAIVRATVHQTNKRRALHTGVFAVSAIVVSLSTVSAIVEIRLTPWAGQFVNIGPVPWPWVATL